ncbi:hypothetical protein BLNAU_23991 [Blattamonas nauphoetae]|uniref:Uncharacterized protein n=1 Tax=Blattamonas nauphoetae TaxID=2049346 RepID=A0ABQ9WNQ5_9EUKA|nr:hypothetical protein BLNAU_23991 [Blattamonas nauphoetae]
MQTSPPNKLRTRTPPNPTRRLALSPNSHRHSSLVFLALQTIVLFILTVNTRSTLTRAMCCSIRFMSVSLRRRESCIARSILSSLSFCQQNCRSSLLNCVELCSSQQTPLPNSPNTRPSFSMHNTEWCVDQCYQKSEGCVLDCGKSDMTECERTCITKLTQCTVGDSGEDNEKNGEKKEEKRGDGMSIMFSQFKIGHEAKATKGCVLPAGVCLYESSSSQRACVADLTDEQAEKGGIDACRDQPKQCETRCHTPLTAEQQCQEACRTTFLQCTSVCGTDKNNKTGAGEKACLMQCRAYRSDCRSMCSNSEKEEENGLCGECEASCETDHEICVENCKRNENCIEMCRTQRKDCKEDCHSPNSDYAERKKAEELAKEEERLIGHLGIHSKCEEECDGRS